MARQPINSGAFANDPTADTLFDAFADVEANFVELYDHGLGDLADVVIGTPSFGQTLVYDDSVSPPIWTPGNPDLAAALGDLADVDIAGSPAPNDGDVLTYDAAASPPVWRAEAQSAGVSLSGNNTWTGKQDLTAGGDLTPAAAPSTTAIGYLGAPQNLGLDSGNYTLVMGDCGKSIDKTTASTRTLTIPANSSVAFPVGTILCGSNEGAGALSIAITTDTLRWGSSTGTRSVAQHGSWTLRKIASTTWRLTGDGIT